MKDIKDLKENELIEVNTIEESVFITKKLKSATPQFKLPYYVGIVGDMYYYGQIENEVREKKVIPASKFLKPSKKELLKRIEHLEKSLTLYSVVTQAVENGNVIAEYNRTKVTSPDNLEVDLEKVEAKSELEVGKWYVLKEDNNCIACYTGEHSAYGFIGNAIWGTNIKMSQSSYWILASETEVKEALTAEAERRGFKLKTKIKSFIHYGLNSVLTLNGKCELTEEGFYYYGCVVMQEGKWAEIIEQPKEEIDFSQVGLIVESVNEVVITNGNYNANTFGGTVLINTGGNYNIGYCTDSWYSPCFKLRKEPITISNEII